MARIMLPTKRKLERKKNRTENNELKKFISPYLRSQPSYVERADVLTVQQHLSLQRIVEAKQQVHYRAFTATGGSD